MPYACLIITFLHTILGYENIALNKPTHQLHAYIYKKYGTAPFDSSNAVDGLKSDLSPYKGQCVISANGYKTATWWVNLTSVYSIHDIRIYYRTDNAPWGASNGYATRFLGFYVYVSNTTNRMDGHLCFHDTNYSRATIPAVLDIACPVHGQYVIYYNERPQNTSYSNQYSTDAHNELCEVEVNGCNKTGYYGTDCSLPCPWNCRYCHIETGACRGCKPGYKGRNCELRCDGGRYGQDCGLACGACLGGRQCHHISGSCLGGCDAGYKGRLCKTVCLPGTFGKNCKGNCSQNCGKPGKCFARTGVCVGGCQPGWEGPQCQKVCKEQKYGENCIHLCGFCRNSTCDLVDGSCMRGCAAGYQGPLCNKVCPGGYYGDNCNKECSLFCKTSRDCHHVTGHCTDGCTGGRRGEQCLQVEEKRENMEWKSRFNGVLAAQCISMAIIMGLVFYMYLNRKRTLKGQKMQENGFKMGPVNIISGENGGDTSRKYPYQKLSEWPM